MLLAGDEMGHTQGGSNNAYCQDNEMTWLDWSLRDEYADLLALTQTLLWLRREHPVFRQRRFFEGIPVVDGSRKDLAWFAPSGREMTENEWHDESLRTLGMFLSGDGIRSRGPHGEPIIGESFLLVVHSGADPIDVTLPEDEWAQTYDVALDTAGIQPPQARHKAGDTVTMLARSCLLLRATS
jgi:glycogen operon protein